MIGRRSIRSLGRWTTTPGNVDSLARIGSSTSIGSEPGRSTPHSDAAVRCDASARLPAPHTAARTCCSKVSGVPASRATFGWICSRAWLASARYQALRDMPSCWARGRWRRPWWVRAKLSMRWKSMPNGACRDAEIGKESSHAEIWAESVSDSGTIPAQMPR